MPKAPADKRQPVTTTALQAAIQQALTQLEHYHERFIIPNNWLPDHPERRWMVQYLQAKSWRGTLSGAASVARVSPLKVLEWREIPEFARLEKMADDACTDLIEEHGIMSAYAGGNIEMTKQVLRARRPEQYSDRQEIVGPKGGPVEFVVTLGGIPRPQKLGD